MDSVPRLTSILTLVLSGLWHVGLTATNYNCDDPLASFLSPKAFSSSSDLTGSSSSAQLNGRMGTGGWSPENSSAHQWLQLDLGNRVEITAVATQGRYGSSDWVTSYCLIFSDTGHNWQQYKQGDSIWTFIGNMNANSVVHHKLLHAVRARFVRFVPLEWNPNGKIGMRVEVYGCFYKSDVADFDGRSSLLYRFNQKTMSTLKDVISLKFKSMQGDGVLFHGEGQRGDHITLELQNGRLALYLNLDDSKARLSSITPSAILGSLLDDQHWHSVLLERVGKQANFTVDRNTQHFRTNGDTDALDIDYELSFGGIPVPSKPGTFLKKNFQGCIENLYYNGVNIIDLAKRRKHQIYSGNVTFSCSEPQIVPITFVNSRSSYLLLPGTPQIDGLSVSFQFRTWNEDGLLLSTELSEGSGTLLLILEGGTLRLLIKNVAGHGTESLTGRSLNNGQWHSVNINARRNRVTLTLDNDPASPALETPWLQIYSGYSYYFGGCPDNLTDSQCLNPIKAFQGCMRLIFIDNQPKDLISVQQGSLGNFSDLHIDLCSIKDRCFPNYCEHGGHCTQTWTNFYCNCSNTGYTGATCHDSIYEQSCEVYRHRGNTAGYFYVDSDGSGPLRPLQVYCNVTEDKIWMTVQHNNTELTWIQGSNTEKPYVMNLNYGGSMEQLEALIDGSEHCEQEVTYYCRRSHLLNTPDGAPFAWWTGRSNERHPYWGGYFPGDQKCGCGLEESCLEMSNDTGFLSFKDHLPVTQIIISDTNRSNSEAAWRIGPLRCYGDPPSEVIFAIDVGNGPMELLVQSPYPLNDNQWHYIQAERNIKETLLHVDNLPKSMRMASEEGHFLLQLNSQLFVGGTSSRQKGFLGCIRSLHLNGQKVDLEERAKITSGVRPGCAGHCNSYGRNCQNGGKCVEKHIGYTCDCTNSPYEGPFCKKEISALFYSGTSVTYMFQEPYPVTKNTSLSSSAIYKDTAPSKEAITLSFMTAQAPTLLLYLNFSSQNFLAILLSRNGSLQIQYRLSKEESHVFTISTENLANRRVHQVKMSRDGPELSIQMDQQLFSYNFPPEVEFQTVRSLILGKVTETLGLDPEVAKANTLGFVGCLSSVQYNHIAPLKAALRHASISPVTVQGTLTESSCDSMIDSDVTGVTTVYSPSVPFGKTDEHEPLTNTIQSDSAFIGGVIAIVTFITFCVLGIMVHFLYQQKQSHRTNQMKEKEYPDNLDSSFRNDIDLQNTAIECKREYFI
uniref:Isoform 2 of Contactin-associated protein like 5-2 n=1 Tax=Mus musculus TaxID=10090 RepID=Q0V8T8-2